jgi:hypothetical protein
MRTCDQSLYTCGRFWLVADRLEKELGSAIRNLLAAFQDIGKQGSELRVSISIRHFEGQKIHFEYFGCDAWSFNEKRIKLELSSDYSTVEPSSHAVIAGLLVQ